MKTESDNALLAGKLRDRAPKPNRIKLPGAITFKIDGASVKMELGHSCVKANMQDNSSSFEGWALAIKRWLPEYQRIDLSWNFDEKQLKDVEKQHYQRFLFRVKHFASLFSWFSIAPSNRDELNKLRTDTTPVQVVTAPKIKRPKGTKDSDIIDDLILNEHKLECFINERPEPLSTLFEITQMDRQYPVGLFEGKVIKGSEIFPRGHSAIDLWGTNKTGELFLFELKARKNTPVGILSELFFYSYIMEGVQQGRFTLQTPDSRISSTSKIRAYMLAPEWHPLIDTELLQIANTAFKESGRQIRFGAVRIVPKDLKVYKLELQACD